MSDSTSPFLTEREMQVLAAVCDTLAPSIQAEDDPGGLFARKATDLGVPELVARTIDEVSDPRGKNLFKLALRMLDQPLLTLALGGDVKSFVDMTAAERTATLRRWSES